MKRIVIAIICISLAVLGYNTYIQRFYEIIYLYPKSKSQCITVFNGHSKRYFLPGKHEKLSGNWVSLDISKVARIGDAIYVCWLNDNGWEIVVPNTSVIKNSLDTNLFDISCSLSVQGKNKIPTAKKFNSPGCGTFDIGHKIVSRSSDDVIFEKGQNYWLLIE